MPPVPVPSLEPRAAEFPDPGGYGPLQGCQVCGGDSLESVVFLGYLPPVNRLVPIGRVLDEEPWFPAEMVWCPHCKLAQLGFAVDPGILFPPTYPYTSGTTRVLRENFAELYQEAGDRLQLAGDELIVDVGSNDGTLLHNFLARGHRVVGIEPSLTAQLAHQRGIPTLMQLFDGEAVERVKRQYGKARIVTATNVFAHIHRVHDVVERVAALLGDRGVFISESHYLPDLVATLQYDTIYHEHLRYYSLTSVKLLLESHGFHVFHAKRIPTHGGSIRVYASRSPAYPEDPLVAALLQEEVSAGFAGRAWIEAFRQRVVRSKHELAELLARVKAAGAQIYGVGAPSRASTLITYVGIDEGTLEGVVEVAGSKKLGHYMPGTKIPVIDEAALYQHQPAYALLLSWHIGEELCRNLKRRGFRGDFIVPLPTPRIISNRDVM